MSTTRRTASTTPGSPRIRKRFSHNLSFEGHYTWGKGLGITGSDIGAYYGSDNDQVNIQEFNNPRADRGPNQGDSTHRFVGDWVYVLPQLTHAQSVLRHAAGRLGSRGNLQRAHRRAADHHRDVRVELALPAGLRRRTDDRGQLAAGEYDPVHRGARAVRCSI